MADVGAASGAGSNTSHTTNNSSNPSGGGPSGTNNAAAAASTANKPDSVSSLASAAQSGSPVDQGKALRALDGITKDPQATNAIVAQGASVQAGVCYSGSAIGHAPEAAASVGVSAGVCAAVNIPTSLSGLGDAGVVANGQVAGGIGQGTFIGAGPSLQVSSVKQTEKTVLSKDCTGYAEANYKETQVSATFGQDGVSSVAVAQGITVQGVPKTPNIPGADAGGFAGTSCSVTVTLTPNTVANSTAAAKEEAKGGLLAFTRGWVDHFMPPGMPRP